MKNILRMSYSELLDYEIELLFKLKDASSASQYELYKMELEMVEFEIKKRDEANGF